MDYKNSLFILIVIILYATPFIILYHMLNMHMYIPIIIFVFIIFYVIPFILLSSVNIWPSEMSKYGIAKYFPKNNVLKTYIYKSKIHNYPCIIKPSKCSSNGKNVSLLRNNSDLDKYKLTMDPNEIYLIQEFYKSKHEIGVLYEKIPYVNNGNVISVVSKDNTDLNEWKPLSCGNIKNNASTKCNELIDTNSFNKIITRISSKVPNFYAGRYDIGFESVDELNKGIFKIYELNGVMGYDLRSNIYGNESLLELSCKLYYILRWLYVRFLIGAINIITLKSNPFLHIPFSINNAIRCNDPEVLFRSSFV